MPNLYNRPVSSGFRNTYSSQFVPLPLEQFARTNELNQAKQDAEVNMLSQTSDAGHKISGIAKEDNEYVADKLSIFDEVSKDLANKDLTQRENQDVAKNLVRGLSRDKNLLTIMSNKAKYDEYQKNREDAIKTNTYQAFNDSGRTTYEDYVRSGGYKSGKSIDPTIYKYEDTRPVRERLVDDMKANGQDIVGKFGETYYKNGFEGISKSQAYQTAKRSLGEYLQTTAGAQDIREFNYMQRNNPKNKSLQKMDASDYVFSKILTAANERVFSKSSSGLAEAKNADAKKKEDEVNLFNGLASNEIASNLLDGLSVKFDNKGNIQGDGRGLFANAKEWMSSSSSNPIDILTKWKNDTRLSDEQNTRLKSVVVGAKLNGVTPEEYTKVFNKTWAPVIPEPLTGKAIKANNDAFYNGGAGLWSHMILSKDGKGSMGFIEALENEFGKVPDYKKNPEEFQDFMKLHKIQVTGAYAPNKLSARPIEVTVNGSTFMADLTNGGKNMENVSKEDITAHNRAKLSAGEQVEEQDSDGNTVIYYESTSEKDAKTGKPKVKYKIIPKK